MATESVYNDESLSLLRALGSNLTAYDGTQEDLLDYDPEKFQVGYTDTTETDGGALAGTQLQGQTTTSSTTRNYSENVYTDEAVNSLKETLLPGIQARLSSIKTQRDQPGRSQLLSTSLLG